jgi:hypothetical protein
MGVTDIEVESDALVLVNALNPDEYDRVRAANGVDFHYHSDNEKYEFRKRGGRWTRPQGPKTKRQQKETIQEERSKLSGVSGQELSSFVSILSSAGSAFCISIKRTPPLAGHLSAFVAVAADANLRRLSAH